MKTNCPDCKSEYESVGIHLAQSSCEYPKLSDLQIEVLNGILMGDGTVSTCNKNPRVQVYMTNKDYLEYIDEIMGFHTCGVKLRITGEESKSQLIESEFSKVSGNKYKDVYDLTTRSSVVFKQYADWYDSGEKIFPESLELTPDTLSHWYVCDGTLSKSNSTPYIKIYCSNETHNKEKIESYFEEAIGFRPDNWNIWERENGSTGAAVEFGIGKTKEIFKYMERSVLDVPMKGFEYKWMEAYK